MIKQNASSGNEIPECFGHPGDGLCEECLSTLKLKCAREFANNGNKSTTKNNSM